uniref:Exonuclease 3'-5' domain containing 3 n=1 Tax=Nothobranchius pienaari TaxID=704102 RepID=A0A1A8QGR2_9TELE
MNHTIPEKMGLDPALLRDQLFELWNQKDLQTLHLAALQGFSKLSEPLEALLTILESCPGKQMGRNHTLGYHVLREFQTWIKERPQGHKQLEQQLVTLLDSWCQPSFSVEDIRKRFPHLRLSKHQTAQIQPKMLTKSVLRLMEKFKIDPKLCPNALQKRRLDTLRYLMYRTFVEKGMTEENWVDHVQNVVADDLMLQVHLVEMLVKYCGYGMAGDLRCLSANWPELSEEPLKMNGILDLLTVHQKIQRTKVSQVQNGSKEVLVGEDCAEKGLSLLIQQVLGKPLDKTEQMSNWEKRPLRISQIRYAVADAYCLLDVYSVLSSNPECFGLPADLRSISSGQSTTSKEKKQKEKQGKMTKQALGEEECQGAQRVSPSSSDLEKGLLCGKMPSEDPPPALPPQQLRVVCDNMLQGLGRYLRCLGVDVVMLENTDDHRVAAKLAQAEGRVILTCGQPYQTLRSQVGEGRCLSLDCSEKAKDQAVRVLRHFNIQPTPGDIFSRCQACNSDQYVEVSRADMTRLLKEKGYLQDSADPTLEKFCQQEEQELDDTLTPAVTPEPPRYAAQCRWASLSGLDRDTLTFPGGSPIQLHTVLPALLQRIPLFYVCTRCGKVFWEGSHFSRVLSLFQEVLHLTDEDKVLAKESFTLSG